jgi:CHAT domain-containing protein
MHHQIAGSGLKEQLEAFRQLNSRPDSGQEAFAELAYSLYTQLLAPVSSHLNQPNLIIIPDGQLGYLPFHLLLTGDEGTNYRDLPYLLRDYSIRYEYAASLLLQDWDRPKPKHTYAGFAPEYQGDELTYKRSAEDSLLLSSLYDEDLLREGLSPLQSNQEEVAFAAEALKGIHYEGSEALESSFKAVAPRSRVLHLAMHALTNDKDPIYSQLIFSREPDTLEDGKLHAYELYNMNLDADLAVLSACETGAGKVQSGEGVMSLSHAFKYAGCPNIVMSLWQAHDRSTSELVKTFFRQLQKGEGKADALRHASLSFLESADERYTHPFYWGGMVVVGDNEPIGRRMPWLGILGVIAVLGSAVYWYFRK